MNPYLVSKIQTKEGKVVQNFETTLYKEMISRQTAVRLKNAMHEVVEEGTGTRAAIQNVEVAGKTGSAENPHGSAHSWFIGFAPLDNPTIAVAVIVENGGYGGGEGAIIAKAIMQEVLKD